jgi:deazaflavin-dependent oxidoreductase (nitroreductase family)
MVSAKKAINLGAHGRSVIRLVARFVNPAVMLIAGRRWMPILGILHHRGRRSGRLYATPLGMRPFAQGFIMPLTFGENAAWYRNVLAAGWCTVTYRGRKHKLVAPEIIDYGSAAPAFPRYERLQFRLLGINQYLRLRYGPTGFNPASK